MWFRLGDTQVTNKKIILNYVCNGSLFFKQKYLFDSSLDILMMTSQCLLWMCGNISLNKRKDKGQMHYLDKATQPIGCIIILATVFFVVGFLLWLLLILFKVMLFHGLQMFHLSVTHRFSAVIRLLSSSLNSTGALQSSYEIKAKSLHLFTSAATVV